MKCILLILFFFWVVPAGAVCPLNVWEQVEAAIGNGTWSSPGAPSAFVTGGACVTFGGKALQIAVQNNPLPQDNIALLTGFSPSDWSNVVTIAFDFYVFPTASPFSAWGEVQVLASDTAASLNNEAITNTFAIVPGMNNAVLAIDWSQGALSAANTLNQLSFRFNGDGLPGAGTVCIDRIRLAFNCFSPTPSFSPTATFTFNVTATPTPTSGLATPTSTLTPGPPSWSAEKQLDNFSDNALLFTSFQPGSAGAALSTAVDGVTFIEGSASVRADYTFNAVAGGFFELLRGYNIWTLDLSFDPVGLALQVRGSGGTNDTVRLMLYEDNDRDANPFEAGEEIWASTPRAIGSAWNQEIWTFSDFNIYAGTGDGILNLNRIYAWRIVINNGDGSAHGGQVWFDDLRQLTSYTAPVTGTDTLDGSFIQIWNTGSGTGCECGQWTGPQWFDEFRKLRDMCQDRVIIQYSVYEPAGNPSQTTAWYPGSSEPQIETTNSTMAAIFAAANTYGVNVVLGLYYRDDWGSADKTVFATYSNLISWQSVVINELAAQYGTHPRFAGWYIPQEANDLEFTPGSASSMQLFNYYQSVASAAKSATASPLPVYISPYFGGNLPADVLAQWYTDLYANVPNLNITLLQDGVGTHRSDGDVDVPHYFAAVKAAVSAAGGGFGAVVESFDQTDGWPVGTGPFAATAANINTFKSQLWEAGLHTPLLINFEHPYMQQSRGGAYAQLYTDYQAYHQPIENCDPTPTPTISATFTISPTVSPTASQTNAVSATNSPSISPSATFSPTKTFSPTNTVSATQSPSVTSSPSVTLSATASATPSITQSGTSTASPSETFTKSPTPTQTIIASATATATVTVSFTQSPTFTNSASPTYSPTRSPTRTASPSVTATSSPSVTPSVTSSVTPSATATASLSSTASDTQTPTFTVTATASFTPLPSASPSETATATPSSSVSVSPTVTSSVSPNATLTATPSATLTATPGVVTLNSLSVEQGPVNGGTVITLKGTGFTSGLNVQFGGSVAPPGNVTIVNSTTMIVTTPPHSEGQVDVRLLWGPATVAILPQAYRYLGEGLPKVLQVSAAPNPLGKVGGAIHVLMEGPADLLRLRLYSSARAMVLEATLENTIRGWNAIPLNATDIAKLANGVYHYQVVSEIGGVEKHRGLTGNLYILK